jgi:hypothetical protein
MSATQEWVYLAAHGDHMTEAEILHLRRATAYATKGESDTEPELTDAEHDDDDDVVDESSSMLGGH